MSVVDKINARDIARTMIVHNDGRSMTLMESLVCSYSVEGQLRVEIAKLQREIHAAHRRANDLKSKVMEVIDRADDYDTDSGNSDGDKLSDIAAVVSEWTKS